jgi:hypothetical protein
VSGPIVYFKEVVYFKEIVMFKQIVMFKPGVLSLSSHPMSRCQWDCLWNQYTWSRELVAGDDRRDTAARPIMAGGR